MLEVDNLEYSYGKQPVLRNISFSAASNTFISVLGPNGAGKTTLFKCLLGLLPGYRGRISIDGRDIREMSANEQAHRMAYIPQSHYPSFNYTVMDMVLMGSAHRLMAFESPGREDRNRAMKALEQLKIAGLSNTGFKQLSGGEQQLVLIARALAQQAKLLLMDEPTANLDYGNQLCVLEQVNRLSREGYTVIMSSHNPQHALKFSEKVLAINHGEVISFDETEKVITTEMMKLLYGVECVIENSTAGNVVVPIIR